MSPHVGVVIDCALCCAHGLPLRGRTCDWCEDTARGQMDPLDPDDAGDHETMASTYRCPHGGIGAGGCMAL